MIIATLLLASCDQNSLSSAMQSSLNNIHNKSNSSSSSLVSLMFLNAKYIMFNASYDEI